MAQNSPGSDQLTPWMDDLKHHVSVLLSLEKVKGTVGQLAVLGVRWDRQGLHLTQLQTHHKRSVFSAVSCHVASRGAGLLLFR